MKIITNDIFNKNLNKKLHTVKSRFYRSKDTNLFSTISLLLLLAGIFFNKPMVLGYYNATIGVFLIAIGFVSYILSIRTLYIDIRSMKIFMINNIVIAYYFFSIADFNLDTAFKNLIVGFFANLAFMITINNFCYNKLIKLVFRFIIFSGCFTAIIIWIFGIDAYLAKIEFFSIPIKDRGMRDFETIYFPFSSFLIFGEGSFFATIYARQMFTAIEPGVAVAVIAVWRCLERPSNIKAKILTEIIFLIALTSTGSSAVPFVIIIYYAWKVWKYKSNISTPALIIYFSLAVLCIAFYMYAPGFGYFEKLETHGESFEERAELFNNSVEAGGYLANSIACAIHYILLRRFRTQNFNFLLPVAVLITVTNVIFALPLYFLIVWMSVNEAPKTPGVVRPERSL